MGYDLGKARHRRLKRRLRKCPALTPYPAERLSTRTRSRWMKTRSITRKHPVEWGHFGKEIR